MEKLIPEPPYLVSEIQVTYKRQVSYEDMPQVRGSKSCYDILLSTWDDQKIDFVEEGKAMYLNNANKVIGVFHLSSGGRTGVVMDPALILGTALKVNAVSIILAHNHPSGQTQPSRADIDLTHKVKNGAEYLDIKVLDHIVMSRDGYSSLADLGMI